MRLRNRRQQPSFYIFLKHQQALWWDLIVIHRCFTRVYRDQEKTWAQAVELSGTAWVGSISQTEGLGHVGRSRLDSGLLTSLSITTAYTVHSSSHRARDMRSTVRSYVLKLGVCVSARSKVWNGSGVLPVFPEEEYSHQRVSTCRWGIDTSSRYIRQ